MHQQENRAFKICFQARPAYDVFSTKIYKYIKHNKNDAISGVFITSDGYETDSVNKLLDGETGFEIIEVTAFFKNHWNEFTYEHFLKYEKKYDCAPIWKYIYMDRFLIEADFEYCIKITCGYFMFWEYVFGKGDIDFYYDEAVSTLHTAIAYYVGCKSGVKYITQMVCRGEIEATHHFFSNDPYLYNMNFDKDYRNRNYPEALQKEARDFLERYEKHDIKAGGMSYVTTRPKLEPYYVATLLPRYLKGRFGKRYNNKYFYMYYKQYKLILNKWNFYFRYRKCRKYYEKADFRRKYVFLALHFQPEASTIVCAQKYEKQLFFIDSWAKSIPADTVLYVKEHYAFLGHRELGFYESLKKYPNVILIDPWENSKKLIRHAVAVTTLTGTVSWEAFLLRKPTFVCGNVFYEDAPGIIHLDDIYGNYLPALKKWIRPSRGEVVQYLCAFLDSVRNGNVYPNLGNGPSDKNIAAVAKSLYDMLGKIDENPSKFGYGFAVK